MIDSDKASWEVAGGNSIERHDKTTAAVKETAAGLSPSRETAKEPAAGFDILSNAALSLQGNVIAAPRPAAATERPSKIGNRWSFLQWVILNPRDVARGVVGWLKQPLLSGLALMALLIADGVYLGARFAGKELLSFLPPTTGGREQALQQSGYPVGAPDISGDWDYRCTAIGPLGPNGVATFEHGGARHGGVIAIHTDPLRIDGTRLWIAKKDPITNKFEPNEPTDGVPWNSLEMAWASPRTIMFRYKTNGAVVLDGVGVGTVVAEENKQAQKIVGDFTFKLPGDKMMWGRMEFRRVTPGRIQNWD